MRLRYENVNEKRGSKALLAFELSIPRFEFNWHYHPEYELTLITKGSGKRMVGDSIENFSSGDLVLIGPGLPHSWVSNPLLKGKKTSVVVQFPENLITPFFEYQEFLQIKKLLHFSAQGLYFKRIKKETLGKIISLPAEEGAVKVSNLISILHELSCHHFRKLSSLHYQPAHNERNENRINKVLKYIQENNEADCTITKAASLVHLSNSAFCKFFKRVTGKTFSDYVNDMRIANASLLLQETDKTITSISIECGFESLTYFNRVFKRKKGISPKEFRKQ